MTGNLFEPFSGILDRAIRVMKYLGKSTPSPPGARYLTFDGIVQAAMTEKVSMRPETEPIPLPEDLAEVFRRIGDRADPPETLGEGFQIIKETFDEAGTHIEPGDMFQSDPTRHEVVLEDSIEYVPCVLDALIVAFSLDKVGVKIRSHPPEGGDPVRFQFFDDVIAVSPEDAVVSFGLGTADVEESDPSSIKSEINEGSTIPNSCSVINAFRRPEDFDRWAENVTDAAVMELEVDEMIAIARAAV